MNKNRLYNLIRQEEALENEKDLPLLKSLIENFPYYPSSYTMLTKLLHDQQSIYFNKYLKLAAAYAGDREALYKYIHKPLENLPSVEAENESEEQPAESKSIPIQQELPEAPDVQEEKPALQEPVTSRITHVMMTVDEEAMAQVDEVNIPQADEGTQEQAGSSPQDDRPVSEEPIPEKEDPEKKSAPIEYLPPSSYDYFAAFPAKEKERVQERKGGKKDIPAIEKVKIEPYFKENFDREKAHSLSEWLSYYGQARSPVKPKTGTVINDGNEQNEAKTDVIDVFLRNETRIKPRESKFYSPHDMAQKSVEEDNTLITETLANIYLNQGLTEKAIEIFQQLALRYPQKSHYFAVKIEEVKNLRG